MFFFQNRVPLNALVWTGRNDFEVRQKAKSPSKFQNEITLHRRGDDDSAFTPLSHLARRHQQLRDLLPFLLRRAGAGERGVHVGVLFVLCCAYVRVRTTSGKGVEGPACGRKRPVIRAS